MVHPDRANIRKIIVDNVFGETDKSFLEQKVL